MFLKKTFDLVPVLLLSNNLNFPPCNCTEIFVYQNFISLLPKLFYTQLLTEKRLGKSDWKQTGSRPEADWRQA